MINRPRLRTALCESNYDWTAPGLADKAKPHAAALSNAHWFPTLADAREKMEEGRRDYNEVRPHSAIGNMPPISLMNTSDASGPP